jgi:hypothetical protein
MVRRLALAALLASACVDRSVVEVDASATATGGSDPQDSPPGADDADAVEPDASYPYCEYNNAEFEPYCPPTREAWGFLVWHVDGDTASFCESETCNACMCLASCYAEGSDQSKWDAAHCPVPQAGTARPECFGGENVFKTCMLTCEGGETCPNGMECVLEPEYLRKVCAWLSG